MKQNATGLRLMLAVMLATLASGCATSPSGGASGPSDRALGCAGWRQIVPTMADVDAISDALVIQIDGHNENGAARGCW